MVLIREVLGLVVLVKGRLASNDDDVLGRLTFELPREGILEVEIDDTGIQKMAVFNFRTTKS